MDPSLLVSGAPFAGPPGILLFGFSPPNEALTPWIGGGIALLMGLLLTPVVLWVAHRQGWIAQPKVDRWHDQPVALLGGVSIYGASVVGILSTGALEAYTWPVWLGATLIFSIGLADDLWEVRPEMKLLAQVVATALLLYAGHAFWRGGPFWASIPLTFLWIIGVTNAVNLIDGLDGLAASVTAVTGTALAVIGFVVGQLGLAVVAAILTGASLGFLAYNAKPARIFMGDCGSLFLGYMLAVIALGVQSTGEPIIGTLLPVVVLAVPIFDTTFVTVTRILSGRRVTKGGNDHTHHRLVRLGLSERGTVVGLSGISAVFALAALTLLWTTAQLFMALLLLGGVASVTFGLYLVGSRSYDPPAAHGKSLTMKIGALMRALAGGVYWKSVGGIIADLLLIVASFIVAAHLRFGGAPPAAQVELIVQTLPGVVVFKIGVFYAFRLYHGVWRHAGTPEVVRLVKASTFASAGTLAGTLAVYGTAVVSPSVFVLDWIVTTVLVGGIRFGFRALRQYFAARRDGKRRVLVYGSDDHGLLVLRHLRQHVERTVVGLLDEDSSQHGLRTQGVDVLGNVDALDQIVSTHDVDEVIVPTQNTSEEKRRRIARVCADIGVRCQYFAFHLEPAAETQSVLSAAGDGAQNLSAS